VQCQLARLNLMLQAALLNQAFGQRLLFAVGNHPADDVAAENIHDFVWMD
jgi:hypothetical protein